MRFVKIVLVTAVLVTAILLEGCISVNVKTEIYPGGSGKRSLETVLGKSAAQALRLSGPSGEQELERQLQAGLPEGASFEKSERDGEQVYRASFDFGSVKELNAITRAESRRTGARAASASLRRRVGFLYTAYTFAEYVPPLSVPLTTEEKSAVRSFDVSYVLNLPGNIVSSNADRQLSASTLSWKVDPLNGRSIRASSQALNILPIAGALFVLAILVAAVVIFVSRRRSAGGQAAQVESSPLTDPTD